MEKIIGGPTHPFADGVTVIVAITGDVPPFVAVKEGIFPVPLAGKPIEGALFVQAKVVPGTGPESVIADVVLASQ